MYSKGPISLTMSTISLVNGTVRHSTRRGTKAGRNVIRRIKTVTGTHNHSAHYSQNGVNFSTSNLINVSCQSKDDLGSVIPSKITSFRTNQRSYDVRSINPYNLIHIPLSSEQREIQPLRLYSLNCRSVKNKALSICDHIISNNIDIMALTETWLGTDVDNIVPGDLIPDGYDFYHVPRQHQ